MCCSILQLCCIRVFLLVSSLFSGENCCTGKCNLHVLMGGAFFCSTILQTSLTSANSFLKCFVKAQGKSMQAFRNNRNVFLAVPEIGSPRSGCQLGQVLVRTLFLPRLSISPCNLIIWTAERESKLSAISCKDANPIHEGSTFMTSSNFNHLTKAQPPNIIPGQGMDSGFQHTNFKGTQTFSL